MSDANAQQEPSMEEILASIRRIISEDSDGDAAAAKETAPPSDDVLELTEVVEDDAGEPVAQEAAVEPEPEPEPQPEPEPEPEPEEPAAESLGFEPTAEDDAARLLSAQAAAAAVDEFARLARAADPRGSGPGLRFGHGDRTLEELVIQLMRPMLREWLDANLPRLVERLVQKEIRNLVRRSEPD